LYLLDHRAHLPQGDFDTATAASIAWSDSAILAALAFAFGANSVTREGKFGGLALVQVFQRDVYSVYEVFRFAGALGSSTAAAEKAASTKAAASAEELAEKILKDSKHPVKYNKGRHTYMGVHTTHTTLLRQSRLSPGVINTALI
jgi:hypothetical protein